MDYEVTEGKEVVIGGEPAKVYNLIWIPLFSVSTPNKEGDAFATVQFRLYREIDGRIEEAPLETMPPSLNVNLTQVLGGIEGGAGLYEAVKEALIGLGKAQGLI